MIPNDLQNQIKGADNMEQIISAFAKFYDLKNSKPGLIAKGTIIAGLSAIVKLCNLKIKTNEKK